MIETRATLAARLERSGLDWIVPQWDAPANVGALFTTRSGGVSAPPFATMNLGLPAPPARSDSQDAVAENRRRLRAFLPGEPVWLRQVHGSAVAHLDASTNGPQIVADAAVTRTPGVVCTVLTADCLPVLLADRAGTVVAIAHAGWRGLAAGVLEAAVAAMGIAPNSITAWLGPSIGAEAFEVGTDVYDALCADDPGASRAFAPLREGKWHADLCALARRRLARAGVTAAEGGHWCTHSDTSRFFSYRRDGATGRMAATIWLRPLASV